MNDLQALLADHPFFAGLDPSYLELIAGCGAGERFEAGQALFLDGEEANRFFVIRQGRVALDVFVPGRGAVTIQTVDDADVFGWSWLFPPYRWHFNARAVDLARVIAFDATCIRETMERDNAFGYALMRRFAMVLERRLEATRMQLLDVYAHSDPVLTFASERTAP